jgi:hypothetical protein
MDARDRRTYLNDRAKEECVPLMAVAVGRLGHPDGNPEVMEVLADLVNRTFWIGVRYGALEMQAADFNPDELLEE